MNNISSVAEWVKANGPAISDVKVESNGNRHTISSEHARGKHLSMAVDNRAEADHIVRQLNGKEKLDYEAGGKFQARNVKKNFHPDQQGALSEDEDFEQPDLA